jgi:hypothetical protein
MLEIIGWIGNIGFISGVIWLSKKSILGWYANILGNVMYLWQAALMNNMSLVWLSAGLIVLNLYGIYKWIKDI